MLLFLLIIAMMIPSQSMAFFMGGSKPRAKVSPLTDEAIAIYDKNFPFDRDPPNSNIMGNFGMPNRDIDGTPIKKEYPSSKKRLADITPEQAKKTFSEMARLYGDERALTMVKVQPICLAFDSSTFGRSLEGWTEVFGLEQSQDMVARNPGLLAVRPDEAAKATDSTMIFSYIVAITRPLGPFLLIALFVLLLTPAIESLTGIQYGINH